MAIPMGLKSVHEERQLLKWIFGGGVAILTVSLAFTNMTGAWVETKAVWFTGLALGAEIMLVAAFSLIVLAETRWRQAVGVLVFAGLAYFCVENGKAAIRHWMDDVFVDSPEALRSRAALADGEAGKLDTLPADTKGEAIEQRRIDREELAALRVEYQQMLAQDEQGIIVAQTALKAQGKYKGAIDGIRADLTEAAMVQRGAEIAERIAVLQAKLDENGAQDAAVTALAPAQAKREEAITLRTQADKAAYREWWAQILLLVAEAARSFGVWAFLMVGTRESARYGRRKDDRLEDDLEPEDAPKEPERQEPQPEIKDEPEVKTEETPPEPEPAPEPDPIEEQAPPTEEEPIFTSDEDEDPRIKQARAAAEARWQKERAKGLDKRIPVGDWREEQRAAAE